MTSPFLERAESDWIASNALAFAIEDRYPVSPGHALVVPRRPIATWFEASRDERQAMFDLVADVEHYKDFLPWCSDSRLVSQDERRLCGEIEVSRLGIRQSE